MKYTLVVEMDVPDGEYTLKEMEIGLGFAVNRYCEGKDIQVAHLELSIGNMFEAFGID